MALKHTTPSSAAPLAPAKWDEDHTIDGSGATFTNSSSTPTTPASGKTVLWARALAGRGLPAIVGEDGLVATMQTHLGRNKSFLLLPHGANTTSYTAFGFAQLNSGPTSGRSIGSTNLFQSMRRFAFSTAAAANSGANWRANNANQFFLGNVAGAGGFHYICRFGTSNASAVTDGRVFVGLSTSNGSFGAVNPSTVTNILGIGYDGGDSNWAVFNNDGTGTATKTDLGVNFPCTTQSVDAYELVMYVPPNSTTVKWAVTRLNTGDFQSGTLSSDIPAVNSTMQPHFNLATGASGSAVSLDLMSLYIESDS